MAIFDCMMETEVFSSPLFTANIKESWRNMQFWSAEQIQYWMQNYVVELRAQLAWKAEELGS